MLTEAHQSRILVTNQHLTLVTSGISFSDFAFSTELLPPDCAAKIDRWVVGKSVGHQTK